MLFYFVFIKLTMYYEKSVESNLNETVFKQYENSVLKKNLYSIENNSMSSRNKLKLYLKEKRKKLSAPGFFKKFLLRKIPIIEWLPKYDFKSNLLADLVSGNIVGVMNIPQGMAYSLLGIKIRP